MAIENDQLSALGELSIPILDAQYEGRQCGACSLCCRLLDVKEIGKPKHGWCQHCRPGQGCTIYADRPTVCRNYMCLWLEGGIEFDDRWFPKQCGIIADFGHSRQDGLRIRFAVDRRTPNRWREEPYYTTIKHWALMGLHGDLDGVRFKTIVGVGDQSWLILPHRDAEMGETGITLQRGDELEYVTCQSIEEASELRTLLAGLDVDMDKIPPGLRSKYPELNQWIMRVTSRGK